MLNKIEIFTIFAGLCNKHEHIGSMAALPPLENVCGIEHLSPAGKRLEAATAPICQNVI
jgi:hypothetical protein